MAILYNKINAFYLIAGSLSALTLLSSLVLAVVSSVPIFLVLTLAILSALVIRFSYKIINDCAEIKKLADDLTDVKQQLEAERVNVINAERKIQDQGTALSAVKKEMQEQKLVTEKKIQELKVLENEVKHKETELASAKQKIQSLEIDAEKKIKALRGLEDIIKQQETDLSAKEKKIQRFNSIINGNEVGNDQRQDPVRERSSSLPSSFFSSISNSKKATSSTDSLPQL